MAIVIGVENMSFQDLTLKKEYRSLIDNVVKDFYCRVLEQSVLYKRAVGFFSSTALSDISKGVSKLIKNGGKIELVASPYLSDEDIQAIKEGYKTRDEIIKNSLLSQLKEPKDIFEEERLNLLAHLISIGKLDIKIAFVEKDGVGIFHEKMGLMYDDNDNIIAFSGSMNESNTAFTHNYESIDVYCSWTQDSERVQIKEAAFDSIWNDTEPGVNIIEFPEIKEEIMRKYTKTNDIDYKLIDDLTCVRYDEEDISEIKGPRLPHDLELYDYQKEAINNWKDNNFIGIFDMATGTGKTYTGLAAIVELYKKMNGTLAVVICCPYQHLVDQWVEDIKKFNIEPIIGYSNSPDKKFKKRLTNSVFDFGLGVKKFFCFICTNQTFKSDFIQSELNKLEGNVLIVVDEAHNFGAEQLSKTLNETYKFRLALSATFERHNDEVGTDFLKSYFGKKCIEYTLERAINEKKLTPYYYYPVIVNLTHEELTKYSEYTFELAKEMSKQKTDKKMKRNKLTKRAEIIAQKRSRLVAGAVEKISKLRDIMQEYINDTHMLIYCGATKLFEQEFDDDIEDVRQIDYITKMLGNDLNMRVAQFTSKEDVAQRQNRKNSFYNGDIQALIAIKCLDEGVNIPKIKTAFILASTTNPKEYIQRRGRVLRLSKGKEYAKIYDFVTLPRPLEDVPHLTLAEMKKDRTLVVNELKRIIEFKNLARNPYDSDSIVDSIVETYELYKDEEFVGICEEFGGEKDG